MRSRALQFVSEYLAVYDSHESAPHMRLSNSLDGTQNSLDAFIHAMDGGHSKGSDARLRKHLDIIQDSGEFLGWVFFFLSNVCQEHQLWESNSVWKRAARLAESVRDGLAILRDFPGAHAEVDTLVFAGHALEQMTQRFESKEDAKEILNAIRRDCWIKMGVSVGERRCCVEAVLKRQAQ